jgi:ATP-binding cassette subfamily B protein
VDVLSDPQCTSALDLATEQMVMERLMADQSVQRTMLIVSHRTSTLKDVDRVVVFDQGRLVDDLTFA